MYLFCFCSFDIKPLNCFNVVILYIISTFYKYFQLLFQKFLAYSLNFTTLLSKVMGIFLTENVLMKPDPVNNRWNMKDYLF